MKFYEICIDKLKHKYPTCSVSLSQAFLVGFSHGKWQALKWYMCSNHDVILVLCFPSIFKLIIWKQAAVHFWS